MGIDTPPKKREMSVAQSLGRGSTRWIKLPAQSKEGIYGEINDISKSRTWMGDGS